MLIGGLRLISMALESIYPLWSYWMALSFSELRDWLSGMETQFCAAPGGAVGLPTPRPSSLNLRKLGRIFQRGVKARPRYPPKLLQLQHLN